MKIMILNGPNLNMLGIRETDIYGKKTYKDLLDLLIDYSKKNSIELTIYQSNSEGELVNKIQDAHYKHYDAIVINPAAYTHTSVAILDALKSVNLPTVEVHISDIDSREDFRKFSYVSLYAEKVIKGLGFDGYIKALDYLLKYKK